MPYSPIALRSARIRELADECPTHRLRCGQRESGDSADDKKERARIVEIQPYDRGQHQNKRDDQ